MNKKLKELQEFISAQSAELNKHREMINSLSGQINALSGASIATPTTSRLIGSGNPPDSDVDLNIFSSVQSSLGEVKDIDMWLWNYFFDDLIYKIEFESQADPSEMLAKGYLLLNGGIYSRLNYLGGLAKLPSNYYTAVDADTIQVVDYTNCFKRLGNNTTGIESESLPQHFHADNHSHNLSGAGHSVDTGKIGEFWTRDNNDEQYHCTVANGDFYTHGGGGSVNVWEGNDGDIIGTSQNYKTGLNDRQRPLGGNTDTRTGNTANASNGVYQDSAPVRPKNYSTNIYMFGGRYIGSTQSQSYQLSLDLSGKKGKKEHKMQIIKLPDNNGYNKRYMHPLNN